jgi:hypothetical protein
VIWRGTPRAWLNITLIHFEICHDLSTFDALYAISDLHLGDIEGRQIFFWQKRATCAVVATLEM